MSPEKLAHIQKALESVYRNFNEDAGPATTDARTRDFIFHMTDWVDDLEALQQLYNDPESHDSAEWNSAVYGGMISHALGHLLAAARLVDDNVSDPFKGYRYSDSGDLIRPEPDSVPSRKRASA